MTIEDDHKKEILRDALSLRKDKIKPVGETGRETNGAEDISRFEANKSVRGLGREIKGKIPRYGEYVKRYTFSMQPSAHDKLVRLAKEYSYPSVSKFLSDLIYSIEEK